MVKTTQSTVKHHITMIFSWEIEEEHVGQTVTFFWQQSAPRNENMEYKKYPSFACAISLTGFEIFL